MVDGLVLLACEDLGFGFMRDYFTLKGVSVYPLLGALVGVSCGWVLLMMDHNLV